MSRKAQKTILGSLAVLFALLCAVQLGAQSTTPVLYSYDYLGRLTKVVDQNGNAATYSYDAVGNLLSITRSSLPANNGLAILGFAPQQGTIGQTVTIQGQGFSSTPGNNTVQFNGTPATVTSSSNNSLTVTVPAGATTGFISVTVASVTVTSTDKFTIIPSPAITSITPSTVLQGATVSNLRVTGVNLAGSTFSFFPAFVPAAITASNVSISGDGTSATMTLTLSSSAVGSFTLVATNASGSSSQLPGPNNTITVLSINPSADADGDGLTNIYEAAISSDPLNPSTANDGIPDGWALFFGLNPSNPAGASQVAPDGFTYLQAFQSGLNPLVPTLAPPARIHHPYPLRRMGVVT